MLRFVFADAHVDAKGSSSRKTRYGKKEQGVLANAFAAVSEIIVDGDWFHIHTKEDRRNAQKILRKTLQKYPNTRVRFMEDNHSCDPNGNKQNQKFRRYLEKLAAEFNNLSMHGELALGNTFFMHGHNQMTFEAPKKGAGVCVIETLDNKGKKTTVKINSEDYEDIARALVKTSAVQGFIHSPAMNHSPDGDLYVFVAHSHKHFHQSFKSETWTGGRTVHVVNLGALVQKRKANYQIIGYDDKTKKALQLFTINPAKNGHNEEMMEKALVWNEAHNG